MTAHVVSLQRAGRDRADETVRRSLKAEITLSGRSVEEIAEAAGMVAATLYRRLAGKGSQQAFYAGEVAVLAEILEVSIDDIYAGKVSAAVTLETVPFRVGRAERSVNDHNLTPSRVA